MESEEKAEGPGRELGYEGVERLVDQVDRYCGHERQRIELTNESNILAVRLELAALSDLKHALEERLRLAPPPGDRRFRLRRAWYARAVAALLTIGGFFFTLLAFDPFRLGWKSVLYSLAIAIVTPYCVGRFLEEAQSRRLLKGLIAVACTAALTGAVLLAVVRGNLFVQEFKETAAPVVVTDDALEAHAGSDFYAETLPLLRIVMALLAVAMELGAGLAIEDARRLGSDSGENREELSKELMEVRLRMAGAAAVMTDLSNEGLIFEARFWRDFYRAMLTRTLRKAATRILGSALVFLFLAGRLTSAQERLNVVIAVDLTASEGVRGREHKTPFKKNIESVGHLLASVPAGSKVTVIGITATSFSHPYVLLSAQVSDDAGYFGERLSAARRQLAYAWQRKSTGLEPQDMQTDVLGALLLASELFRQAPAGDRKTLILYSDMRHVTRDIDLERPKKIQVSLALATVEKRKLLADLRGVHVLVLGADTAGRSVSQWDDLRGFWAAYLTRAQGNLEEYSTLFEPPKLQPGRENGEQRTPRPLP